MAGAVTIGLGVGLCWANHTRSVRWLRRLEYVLILLAAVRRPAPCSPLHVMQLLVLPSRNPLHLRQMVYAFCACGFVVVSDMTSAKDYIELHWEVRARAHTLLPVRGQRLSPNTTRQTACC